MAIKVTAIRDGRISNGGACREWTKLESAGDRRGGGRVRTESAQFRRPTRLAATDAVQPPGERELARRYILVKMALVYVFSSTTSAIRTLKSVCPGQDCSSFFWMSRGTCSRTGTSSLTVKGDASKSFA